MLQKQASTTRLLCLPCGDLFRLLLKVALGDYLGGWTLSLVGKGQFVLPPKLTVGKPPLPRITWSTNELVVVHSARSTSFQGYLVITVKASQSHVLAAIVASATLIPKQQLFFPGANSHFKPPHWCDY